MWKTTPGLARLVEVQAVARDDVEEVVVREPAQQRRLEVVGRDHVLLAPARRGEERRGRVVGAVGEELEREERMRGPALAQVELDRVRAPGSAAVPRDDEVDGEPPEHALARQPPADLLGLRADRAGVAEVGREAAAEVALAARPAEQLVVRREQLDVAERRHAELHARAAELGAGDALLDDAASSARGSRGRRRGSISLVLERHRADALERARLRSLGAPGGGQAGEVDERVPPPGDAVVELDERARPRPACAARRRTSASTTSSTLAESSKPIGCGTPSSRNSRRQPVLVPSGKKRGSAPYIGMPSVSARSRSSVVVAYGHEVAQRRVGDQLADPLEDARPLEQLRAQRPRRAVVRRDQVKTALGRGSG